MYKRKLVIGDIHGGFKALQQVLERAKVSPDDLLIFLGDYVDGWSESPQVLSFLMDLNTRQPCIFLKGNHDALCYEWLTRGESNTKWLIHGGQSTIDAYQDIPEAERQHHINFLNTLKNYYLDEERKLYVHAGFTNLHGVSQEYFPEMFYWDRSLWETALALDPLISVNDDRYPRRFLHYKEIYIGHTPVTRIGKSIPVNAANVWNVDTGAAYRNPLTILDTQTKQFWQSDPVYTFYPNEKGRN
ncbi:metallophosphoesterase family protein [Ascidiimonas aurantiaca]|uniref:metallophosphoesterase family protein n=1 Tax=Ascidiimonas aurantiaca TaxID=1685432 RepID=UPI0030EF0504